MSLQVCVTNSRFPFSYSCVLVLYDRHLNAGSVSHSGAAYEAAALDARVVLSRVGMRSDAARSFGQNSIF